MPTNTVRSARLGDVPALHALIDAFAQRQYMLARTTTELYETIRDFLVIEQDLVKMVAILSWWLVLPFMW